MPFLAPLLLFGAVFAAAPLIIHLLNRRRFKLVEWAPMHYLKLTLRTNRKRLQLEQWILLLIRTIVILLLIFAVARPFLSGNTAVGWLSLGERTSRVILIDDSLSMGLKTNGESAFKRATDQAAALIESIGTQDALTVVTTSSIREPLLRDSEINAEEAKELADQVTALEPGASANNWAATLSELADLMGGVSHSGKEVRIFTDQRASGWSADAAEQAARLEAMGVKVVVVNVGQGSEGNAALVELSRGSGVAMANTEISFVAKIDTDGPVQFKGEYATLIVDGVETKVKMPKVTPGQRGVELRIRHTFKKAGQHTVEVVLPDDEMPGDNRRSIVVEVAEALRVLLVDGEPGVEAVNSETFFIGRALISSPDPLKLSVQADYEWLDRATPGFYDVIVLANVEKLSDKRIQQLRTMVENGTGLIIFAGDQVDPSAYNSDLYAGGDGLLPAMLDGIDGEIQAKGMIVEQIDDTPMPRFTSMYRRAPSIFEVTRIDKIMKVRLPDLGDRSDTRVLAYWDAPDRPAAAIEKRIGKGRVILWTTTADKDWSDWPQKPPFFLGMYEAVRNMAGASDNAGNLVAGEAIRQQVSSNNAPTRADVVRPGKEESIAATIDRDSPPQVLVRYGDTHAAGIYQLSWDVPGIDEVQSQAFAVSPDTRESSLKALTEEELEQLLPGVDLTVIDASDEDTGGSVREIWRTLAMLLLGFVVIESAFATWVGREH